MVTKKHLHDNEQPFDKAAAIVLTKLRDCVAEIVRSLPGRVTKAADLKKTLGLDYKLSWKLFRIAQCVNPLAAGIHVPSPVGLRNLLKAAGKTGVPAERLDELRQAMGAFDQLVKEHAGDRSSFDAMISVYGECSGAITPNYRRDSFRANTHIWGMQAKTQVKCGLFCSRSNPDRIDGALINGFVHLRRMRADTRLVISRTLLTDDLGRAMGGARKPLSEEHESNEGIGLIHEFCSRPLPKLRWITEPDGSVSGELENTDVGNQGALTVFTGTVMEAAAVRYRSEENWYQELNAGLYVPCESLILDMLIQRDMYEAGVVNPQLALFGELSPGASYPAPAREREMLSVTETPVYLGKGPAAAETEDVPRYTELLHYAFERLGWPQDEFDVYRCRIEYPIIPTTAALRFTLPEKPDQASNPD